MNTKFYMEPPELDKRWESVIVEMQPIGKEVVLYSVGLRVGSVLFARVFSARRDDLKRFKKQMNKAVKGIDRDISELLRIRLEVVSGVDEFQNLPPNGIGETMRNAIDQAYGQFRDHIEAGWNLVILGGFSYELAVWESYDVDYLTHHYELRWEPKV